MGCLDKKLVPGRRVHEALDHVLGGWRVFDSENAPGRWSGDGF